MDNLCGILKRIAGVNYYEDKYSLMLLNPKLMEFKITSKSDIELVTWTQAVLERCHVSTLYIFSLYCFDDLAQAVLVTPPPLTT